MQALQTQQQAQVTALQQQQQLSLASAQQARVMFSSANRERLQPCHTADSQRTVGSS